MSIVADRRLYLTRDKTRIVEEGDPEAGFLFVAPGHVISDADAKEFGLDVESEPEPVDLKREEMRDVKAFNDTEDKMIAASENKAKRRKRKRKLQD